MAYTVTFKTRAIKALEKIKEPYYIQVSRLPFTALAKLHALKVTKN